MLVESKEEDERNEELGALIVYAQLYLGKAVESLKQAASAKGGGKTNYLEEAGYNRGIFEEYITNAFRLNPKSASALMLKGVSKLYVDGSRDEARELFEKALIQGRSYAYIICMNAVLAKDPAEAQELLEKIVEHKDRYGEFAQLAKAESEVKKKNYGLGTELMEGLLARLNLPEEGDVGFQFHAIDRLSKNEVLNKLVGMYSELGDASSIQRVLAAYVRDIPPVSQQKKVKKKGKLKVVG